jgi:hypothetical protein
MATPASSQRDAGNFTLAVESHRESNGPRSLTGVALHFTVTPPTPMEFASMIKVGEQRDTSWKADLSPVRMAAQIQTVSIVGCNIKQFRSMDKDDFKALTRFFQALYCLVRVVIVGIIDTRYCDPGISLLNGRCFIGQNPNAHVLQAIYHKIAVMVSQNGQNAVFGSNRFCYSPHRLYHALECAMGPFTIITSEDTQIITQVANLFAYHVIYVFRSVEVKVCQVENAVSIESSWQQFRMYVNVIHRDVCRIAIPSWIQVDNLQGKPESQDDSFKEGPMTPAPFAIPLVFVVISFQNRPGGSPNPSVFFLPV